MWKLIDTDVVGQCLCEETGAKVFVTSYLEKPTTPEQELEYGWARRLDAHVSEAIRYFGSGGDIRKENLIVQSSPFAEAFEPGKNPLRSFMMPFSGFLGKSTTIQWSPGRALITCF